MAIENLEERLASVLYDGIEDYGELSDFSESQVNSVMANFINQAATDPNFEAKLELLERTPTAFGTFVSSAFDQLDATGSSVSQKGYHGFLVEIDPDDLSQQGFSVMDTALAGVAEFQKSEAQYSAEELDSYPPTSVVERTYLMSANWLHEAAGAGVQGVDAVPMPQYINEFFDWQIDDAGNVVEIDQSGGGAMNTFSPDFSLPDQSAETQTLDEQNTHARAAPAAPFMQ